MDDPLVELLRFAERHASVRSPWGAPVQFALDSRGRCVIEIGGGAGAVPDSAVEALRRAEAGAIDDDSTPARTPATPPTPPRPTLDLPPSPKRPRSSPTPPASSAPLEGAAPRTAASVPSPAPPSAFDLLMRRNPSSSSSSSSSTSTRPMLSRVVSGTAPVVLDPEVEAKRQAKREAQQREEEERVRASLEEQARTRHSFEIHTLAKGATSASKSHEGIPSSSSSSSTPPSSLTTASSASPSTAASTPLSSSPASNPSSFPSSFTSSSTSSSSSSSSSSFPSPSTSSPSTSSPSSSFSSATTPSFGSASVAPLHDVAAWFGVPHAHTLFRDVPSFRTAIAAMASRTAVCSPLELALQEDVSVLNAAPRLHFPVHPVLRLKPYLNHAWPAPLRRQLRVLHYPAPQHISVGRSVLFLAGPHPRMRDNLALWTALWFAFHLELPLVVLLLRSPGSSDPIPSTWKSFARTMGSRGVPVLHVEPDDPGLDEARAGWWSSLFHLASPHIVVAEEPILAWQPSLARLVSAFATRMWLAVESTRVRALQAPRAEVRPIPSTRETVPSSTPSLAPLSSSSSTPSFASSPAPLSSASSAASTEWTSEDSAAAPWFVSEWLGCQARDPHIALTEEQRPWFRGWFSALEVDPMATSAQLRTGILPLAVWPTAALQRTLPLLDLSQLHGSMQSLRAESASPTPSRTPSLEPVAVEADAFQVLNTETRLGIRSLVLRVQSAAPPVSVDERGALVGLRDPEAVRRVWEGVEDALRPVEPVLTDAGLIAATSIMQVVREVLRASKESSSLEWLGRVCALRVVVLPAFQAWWKEHRPAR